MAGLRSFNTSTKLLVSLGFVIGIGLVMLSELQNYDGISTTANTTVGEIVTGISEFGGWIALVVLIIVGTYLMKAMDK